MSYGYWQAYGNAPPGVNTNYAGYGVGGYSHGNFGAGRGFNTPVIKYAGYQPTRGTFSGHRGAGGFQRSWGSPVAANVSKAYNYDKSMKVYMHGSATPGNSFNRPSCTQGKRPGEYQSNSQYGKKIKASIKPSTSVQKKEEDFTEDKFGDKIFRSFEGPSETVKKPDVIKLVGVKKSTGSSSTSGTTAKPSVSTGVKTNPGSVSSTASVTPKVTVTSKAGVTSTASVTPTASVTSQTSVTSKVSVTPQPSGKPKAVVTPQASVTPQPSVTSKGSVTPTAKETPTAVVTSKASATAKAGVTPKATTMSSTSTSPTTAAKVEVAQTKANVSMESSTGQNLKKKEATLKCRFCVKVFPNLVEKMSHEAVCPDQRYHCGFCKQEFYNTIKLESHLRGNHVIGRLPYECCVCSLAFMDYMAINRHMEAHLDKSDITKDEMLKKSEEAKKEPKHHTIKELPRARDGTLERVVEFIANEKGTFHGYKCPYCEVLLADFSWIQQHIREHTNYFPNWCAFCTRRFFDKSHLTKHLVQEHVKAVPYECECGLKMKKAIKVNNHRIQHHTSKNLVKQMNDPQELGTETFKVLCGLCGVLFHNKTIFLKHQGQCKTLHPL